MRLFSASYTRRCTRHLGIALRGQTRMQLGAVLAESSTTDGTSLRSLAGCDQAYTGLNLATCRPSRLPFVIWSCDPFTCEPNTPEMFSPAYSSDGLCQPDSSSALRPHGSVSELGERLGAQQATDCVPWPDHAHRHLAAHTPPT